LALLAQIRRKWARLWRPRRKPPASVCDLGKSPGGAKGRQRATVRVHSSGAYKAVVVQMKKPPADETGGFCSIASLAPAVPCACTKVEKSELRLDPSGVLPQRWGRAYPRYPDPRTLVFGRKDSPVDDNSRAKCLLSPVRDSRFAVTPDRGLPAARPVTAKAARGLFKIAGGPLDGHRRS
jgi:hypothetical protein